MAMIMFPVVMCCAYTVPAAGSMTNANRIHVEAAPQLENTTFVPSLVRSAIPVLAPPELYVGSIAKLPALVVSSNTASGPLGAVVVA